MGKKARLKKLRKDAQGGEEPLPAAAPFVSGENARKIAVVGKFFESSSVKLFLLLFILALIPRLVCLLQMQNSVIADMLALDQEDYNAWGLRIAKGDWIGSEVFYGMPLYAYFLGFVYRLFGHGIWIVRLIQVLLGALNCTLIFYIARKVFKDIHIALIAFAIAFFFKLSVFYELLLDGSTIATFIFLAIIYVSSRISDKPSRIRCALLGTLVSIAVLVRANFLILAPLIVIWLMAAFDMPKARKAALIALFMLPIVISISLVTMRNYHVAKDLIPLTAHGGINFYLGNGPYADGRYPNSPFTAGGSENMIKQSFVVASRELNKKLKPSEASSYWSNKAFEFIRENPRKYVSLLLNKTRLFISGFEMPDILSYTFSYKFIPMLRFFFITFALVIPLGISGMVLSIPLKNRMARLLLILFLGYSAGIISFMVNERYKVPLYPFFIIFSSYGLAYLFRSKGYVRKTVFIIVCLLLFLPSISTAFMQRYGANQGAGYIILGYHLLEKNDVKGAVKCFETAVGLLPKAADAHNSLGLAYINDDNLAGAEEEFKKAIKFNPNLFQAYYSLAELCFKKGEVDEGNRYMNEYKRLSPYENGDGQ